MPVTLPQISSRAWEHPADRAALEALRTLPGFDDAVRGVAGFLTDRGVRRLFLDGAVRATETTHAEVHALLAEVCATLDWPTVPELYVTTNERPSAFAVGFSTPFIAISTGMLASLPDNDSRRFLLAHELGHIMSGHMVYHTLAVALVVLGAVALGSPMGLALLPFHLALLEWHRKGELSSDRAALLAVQDGGAATRYFIARGGSESHGEGAPAATAEEYLSRAATEASAEDGWERALRAVADVFRFEPAAADRALELDRWRTSGGYDAIVAGAYTRRGEREQGLGADWADAARHYSGKHEPLRWNVDVGDAARRARDAFKDAWRGGPTTPPPASDVPPGAAPV